MTSISTRPSPKELEYLSTVASKSGLYKGNSEELSIGKAIHAIIRWCHLNEIDITKKQVNSGLSPEIEKMIEHIHIAIPNLMYLARLQSVLANNGIPQETIIQGRRLTLDYLNETCGDFQNAHYNQVRFSINKIGLKSTPSDKDKTLWKLQSI